MEEDTNVLNAIVALSKQDINSTHGCKTLAESIKSGKYTITNLVNDLGPLLTSSSVDEREKGTIILSTVLANIPENILCATQLNYICNFYSQRLNDNHQVVPAVIKGLSALISFKNVPEGSSTQLLRSLLQHVPCQQQHYPDRYNIYNFLKCLLDRRKEEMKGMGKDFVYGVISIIDGERDPRNLLFLFNWLPTFLQTVELDYLAEEMFEVMGCYFPIDFRAPTQDNITRDTLAHALCKCLCSIPSFGNYCIPLAIEKMESELLTAKLDSLDLLVEGCKYFSVESYKQHSSEIWPLIQKEIFKCNDNNLEEKCLLTLTSVLRKISVDTEFATQTVIDIIDILKGNLRPDAILFVPSVKLLKSIANSSGPSAELVFSKMCPLLINIYNITNTSSHKASILRELFNITFIYLSSNHDDRLIIDENDDMNSIFATALKAIGSREPEIRSTGIRSFSCIAKFIGPSIRDYFYQSISTLLLSKQESLVYEALIDSLKVFAELYYKEVQTLLENMEINGLDSHESYLEVIGCVVFVKDLMPFSLSILVENITKPLDKSILALKILKQKLDEDEVFMCRHLYEVENIIEKLLNYLIENLANFNIDYHEEFLCNASIVLNVIIRNLDNNNQESIIDKQLEKIRSLPGCTEIIVIICSGLFKSVKCDVNIPIDIVNKVVEICFATPFLYICSIGSQLLANIINKTENETTLATMLNGIASQCDNLLNNNQQTENVIKIMAFTAKALTVKNYNFSDIWIKKLFELSASNINAARTFEIILNDSYDCLNTKSFCSRRLLYKQKFFCEMTTYLVENYDDDKKYYLTILGYMLPHIPQQLLQIELKKIIRLILLSLGQCEEFEVLQAVLSAINEIIENKDPVAEDYMQEFLKYYSKLVFYESSMKIRMLSLKGIQLYTEYPLYKLLPLKQDILNILSKCLDDKKRLVRKEAVQARSKWFLIDAPM